MDDSTPTEKVCCKCGETKPLEQFSKNRAASDGLNYRCKPCVNAARKANYWANRERDLERGRQWRAENKDRHRELTKAWEAANAERIRESRQAWRERNKERHQETRSLWLMANPDYYAKWNEENREKIRAASRRYREAHPEVNAEMARRRRARMRQVEVDADVDLESLWTGLCGICGEPINRKLRWPNPMSKSLDHIIPIARMGTHTRENLQWVHLVCNMRKGDRLAG